jgi:hypothetical protein
VLRLLVEFVPRTSSTLVATWCWQTEGRSAERVILGVRPSGFILSEFNLLREEFLSAPIHSPLSGRLIGPSKSQVLADFVVDWTSRTHNFGEEIPTPWIVQCDGAWCHKGVGISVIITSPTGVVIRYAARLIFAKEEHSSNNTTEYEALLLALRKMKAPGQQNFIIRTDSKVIQ